MICVLLICSTDKRFLQLQCSAELPSRRASREIASIFHFLLPSCPFFALESSLVAVLLSSFACKVAVGQDTARQTV